MKMFRNSSHLTILFVSSICYLVAVEGHLLQNAFFRSMNICDGCKCGLSRLEKGPPHAGGTEASPFEFPWMAAVLVRGELTAAASLITNQYVITAATPIIGLTGTDIKVALGSHLTCHHSKLTSSTYSISTILVHPEFDSTNLLHDIVLLRLTSAVHFTPYVLPVCLPTPGRLYDGQVATIASWSPPIVAPIEKLSCRPRKVSLPIVAADECDSNLDRSQGCVGVAEMQSPLCKEDAGAAVLSRVWGHFELVGILSNKQSCQIFDLDASTHLPVYSSVEQHLPWIIANVRDSCFCNKP